MHPYIIQMSPKACSQHLLGLQARNNWFSFQMFRSALFNVHANFHEWNCKNKKSWMELYWVAGWSGVWKLHVYYPYCSVIDAATTYCQDNVQYKHIMRRYPIRYGMSSREMHPCCQSRWSVALHRANALSVSLLISCFAPSEYTDFNRSRRF